MTLSVILLGVAVDGPRTRAATVVTALGAGAGMLCTCLRLWRWPSRRQSMGYALLAGAATALVSLTCPQPLPTLTGCIAFATIGAYIAFFHTVRFIAYTFAIAALVAHRRGLEDHHVR